MTKLFLDDIRHCPAGFAVARTSCEAIAFVSDYGCPDYISFDHDLGGDDTAMVFVKWLIEQDLDSPGTIPNGFLFVVHSANPCGKLNIEGLLNSYLAHRAIVL